MNILLFTGSHRPRSNSGFLAEHFTRGAREAGHRVDLFPTAEKKIRACIGCGACQMEHPCIFYDDFSEIRDTLLAADLVAFALPVYYFGMPGPIQLAIDRFYSADKLMRGNKKAALIAVCASPELKTMDAVTRQYDLMLDYLGWQDAGRVLAVGFGPQGSVKNSPFVQQAFELGTHC